MDYFDLRPVLRKVSCPALVLYPDRSSIFHVEQSIAFYRDLPKGELPVKCAILSSKSLEETKEVLRQIEEEIKGLTSVTSGDGWLDAYSEDGGKGSAVSWLQEKYNISVDETIAFGDSLNDSSMMEFAKYSVTMKNADDEFKEYCHYEIGSNEDQAVINILEKFVETGNAEFMENYKL